MKTPEELAEEYKENNDECEFAREAYLAGYKAAQEHAHAALEEAEARIAELEDQVAGVSKVMNSPEDPDGSNFSNNLNGWISVKDRLPETDEYLTIGYIDGIPWLHHCAVYSAKDGKWMQTTQKLPRDITQFVKYWMPLPKPPTDE